MTSSRWRPDATPAWVALGVTVVLTLAVAVVPDLRSPVLLAAAPGSALLVVVGMALHRTVTVPWVLVVVSLTLWAVGTVDAQRSGTITALAETVVSLGQVSATLLAVAIGVDAVRTARRRRGLDEDDGRSRTGAADLLIIGTVLALVVVQLVVVGSREHAGQLAAATADVAIIGLLVRFAVSRRLHHPASSLLLVAGALTIAYDLTSAVQGQRVGLPGQPGLVLGVACVLVFSVAALHPSMREGLSGPAFSVTRPASTSLLGLLPLVLVPLALWWVADATGSAGLPPWVLLVGGAVVAGMCLVRAAGALRDTEHLADHDPLTALANRRGLARLWNLTAHHTARSLLLVDVDEFKQVNDTHGHDVGDALLVQVRDRLVAAADGVGTVARLGGDEFVVVTTPPEAELLAGRVLERLREPVHLRGIDLQVSASIGLAEATPGTTLAETLIRADIAMYAAKAAGRDGLQHFDPQMRVDVARRWAMSTELRRMLGADEVHDAGHLVVHYQPLVELCTGEPVGSEALVRWQHPVHGLLPPGEFLPTVTSSNLDGALDVAILARVVQTLARWRDEGRRVLPVSVNLTRHSLEDPDLAERVLGLLARWEVPPAWIHLEITEHEELPTHGSAASSLRTLSDAGIQVHLDDYGTGYTSLDYLRRFPVGVLKLDRSVVVSIEGEQASLVAAVAAMARTLELTMLAEGIETEDQRAALVRLGVRYGQGYLFARPMPEPEFADTVLGPAAFPRPALAAPAVPPAATGPAAPARGRRSPVAL